MVLKFGKRGVRSGVTLKSPSPKFLRQYRKCAYIIREDMNCNGEDITGDTFGVDDIHDKDIRYSLNKKGRWLLPEKLIGAIKSGQFELEEYGVQLFEKHNFKNKTANCVSAYFSKGHTRGSSVTDHKGKRNRWRSAYMSAQSLKNTNRGFTNRKKHLLNDENHLPKASQREVTFEVVYPGPIDCSLTHTYKQTWYDLQKPRQRSKHTKVRRRNQHEIAFDSWTIDDDSDILQADSEIYGNACEDNMQNEYQNNNTVDLTDFLYHAITNSSRARAKTSQILTDYVIIPDDDIFINEAGDDDQALRVILGHSDTDTDRMSRLYGDMYVECRCFPRKFVIDISGSVMALDAFSQNWKQRVKQVQACLVFVHDIENEINTTRDGVYKIYLNTSFTRDMRIETIFNYTETNIEECIERTLFFVETLPNLVQAREGSFSNSRTHSRGKKRQEDLYGWKNETYAPSDEFLYNSYLSSCSTNNIDSASSGEEYISKGFSSIPFGQVCGVCCEDIGAESSGTALSQCGHWFCDDCWEEHLKVKLKLGSIHVHCPEYSCKSEVDTGTMLSILCIEDVIKLIKFRHDIDVDRKQETKWCPNVRCGRVLVRDDPGVAVVTCDCGQKVCFDCLGPAHWPAPCQSLKQYQNVLREIGFKEDQEESTCLVAVHGMQCPGCKRFFEKIDGCPCMTCFCGFVFCWGCGKDWFKEKHNERCSELGYQLVHSDLTCKLLYSASIRNEWIDTALEHCLKRQPDKMKVLRLNTVHIVTELKAFMNRGSNNISLNFKGSKIGYTKESNKLPELVQHLIDIYVELRFIAENMAASLAFEDTSFYTDYFKAHFKKVAYYCKNIEKCLSLPVNHSSARSRLRTLQEMNTNSLKLIKTIVGFTKKINRHQEL